MTLEKAFKRDLSPKAVKKAVFSTATQKPLTVYSAAVAVLGSGFALMVNANPIALAAVGVGIAVGAGNWAWEYFVKGDQHANSFVRQFRKALEQRRQEALEELVITLSGISFDQGLAQVELFRRKYDSFVEILDKKLNPEELTYNRYLSIAEQVFLGGLDNLETAALALKSVSAIQIDAINRDLGKYRQQNDTYTDAHVGELQKRLDLYENQHAKVKQLMLENERALTQLDLVSTKIANINTRQGRAQIDLEDAMAELRHLIERADNYSR